jgi:hypothetical protein
MSGYEHTNNIGNNQSSGLHSLDRPIPAGNNEECKMTTLDRLHDLPLAERNELNDTQYTHSHTHLSYTPDDVAVEKTRRNMLDLHEEARDWNGLAAAKASHESQEAYTRRLKAIHEWHTRKGTESASDIDCYNRPTEDHELSPEVLAVLQEQIEEDQFMKATGGDQLEDQDAIWSPDAIRDCVQYNVAGSNRYTAPRDEASSRKWLTPTLSPDASDRGSLTSESGSSQYRTELDVEKLRKHERKHAKARQFHGIDFVLDSKGNVRTPERLQMQRKPAPSLTPRQQLRMLKKRSQ